MNNNIIETDNTTKSDNRDICTEVEIGSDSTELDPWDQAINDTSFYKSTKIARIFPQPPSNSDYSKIQIDDESMYYITIREIADLTSKIICYHLVNSRVNPLRASVFDLTAGVGGNVLSFGKFFKQVYAVEIDETRCEYLKENLSVYSQHNVNVTNGCGVEFLLKNLNVEKPNVVFVDPPWGGTNYKSNTALTLKIGDIPSEEFVIGTFDLIDGTNSNTKFIVMKLPKNYDIEHMYGHLNGLIGKNYTVKSYLYVFSKMFIYICEYCVKKCLIE